MRVVVSSSGSSSSGREPFLVRLGLVLGSSLDPAKTLQDLVELCVPEFADGCSVHVRGEGKTVRTLAVRFADPRKEAAARKWSERSPSSLADAGGVGAALRDGVASFALDIAPGHRSNARPDATQLIEEFGIRSAIVVPVLAPHGAVAAITFLMAGSERRFVEEDVALAQEVARRAAVAMENARLHAEARAQATRADLLAEASRRFASSLDPAATAREIIDLAIPSLADWGIVYAMRPDGSLERIAYRHRDPERMEVLREIARRWPQGPRIGGPIAATLGEARTVILDPIPQETPSMTGVDQEHSAMQASLGLGASVLVPLVSQGRVIGLLALTQASSERHFSPEDVRLIEELGLRAGAAFHSARLHAQLAQLQQLTGRLASTLSVNEVAALLVEEAASVVGAENAMLSLADEAGQRLEIIRRHAVAEEVIRPFMTIPVDADLPVAEAFRTGRDLYIESREQLHAGWGGVKDAQMRTHAWAILVLRAGDRAVGALWFGFPAPRRFDPATQAFLRTLADHGAQTLARAKLAEAALVRQQLLESQNEATLDGIFFQDASGKPAFFNKRLIEIFDVSPDVPKQERLEDRLASSMRSIADPAAFHELVMRMEKETDASLRFDLVLTDGRILDAYTTPVLSPEGARLGRAWYYRDVTESRRLQRELVDARLQLAQREKLAAMGTLVSGVAHEIRTPLAYLANHAHLIRSIAARSSLAESAQLRESVGAISEGVERIDQLVQDLRRFTKVSSSSAPRTLVDEAVASAGRLFTATHPGRVKLHTELAAPVHVGVERVQLQQILLNFMENAADVSPSGARILVRSILHDDQASVEIIDEGPGIPPDVQGRMWEPFFTTKKEGTGLGLSIVRRIVETNGGTASCMSEPGKGARFRVSFPVAPASEIPAASP